MKAHIINEKQFKQMKRPSKDILKRTKKSAERMAKRTIDLTGNFNNMKSGQDVWIVENLIDVDWITRKRIFIDIIIVRVKFVRYIDDTNMCIIQYDIDKNERKRIDKKYVFLSENEARNFLLKNKEELVEKGNNSILEYNKRIEMFFE